MTEQYTSVCNFLDQAYKMIGVAEKRFDIDLSSVIIVVGPNEKPATTFYEDNGYIVFDLEFVLNHYEAMVSKAIPHEVAHIVTYYKPELGCNHDLGWQKVKEQLESTAELVGS